MSYYEQEDQLPESTESRLASIQQQANALGSVDQFADEAQQEVWNRINDLWNTVDDNGKAQLQALYDKVEQIKKTLKINVETTRSVIEVTQQLGKEKEAAEAELSEIQEAIYDIDTDHPLLHDLVQELSDDAYEFAVENVYQESLQEAKSAAWDEVSAQIKRLFPKSQWTAIHQFTAALDGQMPLNDIQRGLFLSLLQTFAVEAAQAS